MSVGSFMGRRHALHHWLLRLIVSKDNGRFYGYQVPLSDLCTIYGPARDDKGVSRKKHHSEQMPPYIRPLGEGLRCLRALMKSALPLLNKSSVSKPAVHDRVWGSWSDRWCHQLESTSHLTVGYVNLLGSPSPLFLSSLLPGNVLDNSFLISIVPWIPLFLVAVDRFS
jgi:hypothetical protein